MRTELGGPKTCRKCGAELVAGTRYCTRCGEPTRAQHKRLDAEFRARIAGHGRATWAVAWVFAGTMVAIAVASGFERAELVQTAGMLLVGITGCLLLGRGALRASFGGGATLGELGLGVGAGVLGLGAAVGYVWLLTTASGMEGGPIPDFPWWSIVLLPPLLEEWLDRGVLWEAMSRIAGPRTVLLGTTTLFAVSHGLNGGFWLEFPHRFAGGLLLGLVRQKSGSLLPCILGHMVWNGAAYALDG